MKIILFHAPLNPRQHSKTAQTKPVGNGTGLHKVYTPAPEDDYIVTPYGLFSIAAQAQQNGHSVAIYNISTFSWQDIRLLIEHIQADIFGISCYTINRWGVADLAHLLKEMHPETHIVTGGPHASALPEETLEHFTSIDSVVIGEGESTFLELVGKLEQGMPLAGIPGLVHRNGPETEKGPARERIVDIDSLVSPFTYYDLYIALTSRGCPEKCTFCASPGLWDRTVAFHSVEYTLNMLEQAVWQKPFRFLMIKDDTFTANKTRAKDICRGIIERNINFTWSCDTRIDYLDEELLLLMRKAGCQRLSFGIESGSQQVLNSMNKRADPENVLRVTRLCKKYGFQVRFYMIYGNRGETPETVKESLALIEKAKPHQYVFAPLTILPGTEEYRLLAEAGRLSPDDFFADQWNTLVACFAESEQARNEILSLCYEHSVNMDYWDYSITDYENIVSLVPDLGMAYLDLAGALIREGNTSEAKKYLLHAEELEAPFGFIYNYRACIAALQKDYTTAQAFLEKAWEIFPHYVVMRNMRVLQEWQQSGASQEESVPQLLARHDFEMHVPMEQPELPGVVEL